jgi:hypothetical protein
VLWSVYRQSCTRHSVLYVPLLLHLLGNNADCSCMQGPNINGQSCTSRPDHQVNTDSRGRILGRNPDKSLKSFPPCFSQSPLQLSLDIYISSNSHNLLGISTVQLLYTVKEKEGKPDKKLYPLPYGLRNPYRNLKSAQAYAQKPQ